MKRNYVITCVPVCILFALLSFSGCDNIGKERLSPFGWAATGNLAVDSAIVRLDRSMQSYVSADSLSRLADGYCRISEAADPEGKMEHRRLYWQGNALFLAGDVEKGDSLRRLAFEKCDSSLFPHDWRLYRLVNEQLDDLPDDMAKYRRYTSDLSAFLQEEDLVSAATRAVQLSGLMSSAALHMRAKEYALTADSLLGRAGLTALRDNYRVNLASCIFLDRDTVGAVAMLRELRESENVRTVEPTKAIIDFNIYQMCGDTAALYRAWRIVEKDARLEQLRILVAAAIVKENGIDKTGLGKKDFSSLLQRGENYVYSAESEVYIAEATSALAEDSGDFEAFRKAVRRYADATDEYLGELKRSEIVAADVAARVHDYELREELHRQESIRNTWIVILSFVSVILVFGLMSLRHIQRLKRRYMLAQLESERLNREKLALDLMQARKGPGSHYADGDISPRKPVSNTEDGEFMQRFVEKYPGVGKTGRRLALYIRRGMETGEIATAMNIRNESVLQARWRLRTQMRLGNDQDLDIEICRV